MLISRSNRVGATHLRKKYLHLQGSEAVLILMKTNVQTISWTKNNYCEIQSERLNLSEPPSKGLGRSQKASQSCPISVHCDTDFLKEGSP